MKRCIVTVLALTLLAVPRAQAQTVKQFKDWLVSCDNRHGCAAFGFEARNDVNSSYVRIDRAPEPSAAPTIVIQAVVDKDVKDVRIRLSIQDGPGGVFAAPFPAAFGRVTLTKEQAGAFITTLNEATGLGVTLLAGTAPAEQKIVSLDGAIAALRFMDAEQRRAGGVTAIVAKGPAPASAVPEPPALPVVTAVKIAEMVAPLPVRPPGVQASEDCSGLADVEHVYMAFTLDAERTLWGACQNWGAYNQDYKFFIVAKKHASPAPIDGYAQPGQASRSSSAGMLASPVLDKDGKTILSVFENEGGGDCGVSTNWVWDGQALRLVEQRAMPICRGVSIEDWPIVFKATVR